ncbi:hypothetical protein [Streptacidiphilus sp. EB103A]|uniref:hypothetical protein n=1 Tax=Streptacidiphilus sp. EB103A TaxID=3156275 RepID=UPI00351433DC
MNSSVSPTSSVDLREVAIADVVGRVERALGVRLDGDAVVLKRRSVGAPSDRGTWVRIERRPCERVGTQGWGIECAAGLQGVAMPAWYAGLAWRERDGDAMWRADEIGLLPAAPLRKGGPLVADPLLTDSWWETMNQSLDALAGTGTSRIATPDTVEATQDHVLEVLGSAFHIDFDANISEWTAAHADLNWANVTGPAECFLFDWEDWGLAPRGLDSATLWCSALAVPALADRVLKEREGDLTSRGGMIIRLFALAKILAQPDESDPLLAPALRAAGLLLESVRRGA